MSSFSISFQDVNDKFNQTGKFSFKHPHLESNIDITFEDCNNDVERFIKVNKTIKLYNKKICLIKDDETNETIETTHSDCDYYKTILGIKRIMRKSI